LDHEKLGWVCPHDSHRGRLEGFRQMAALEFPNGDKIAPSGSIVCRTLITFSLWDRIKILFGWRVDLEGKLWTQHEPGVHAMETKVFVWRPKAYKGSLQNAMVVAERSGRTEELTWTE
jgi:hypothetical protein